MPAGQAAAPSPAGAAHCQTLPVPAHPSPMPLACLDLHRAVLSGSRKALLLSAPLGELGVTFASLSSLHLHQSSDSCLTVFPPV